jgi:hypothetical protein
MVVISQLVDGFGTAFGHLWTGQIQWLSFLGNFPEIMHDFGGIHIHSLNSQMLADCVV